jgi:hypothetical protein
MQRFYSRKRRPSKLQDCSSGRCLGLSPFVSSRSAHPRACRQLVGQLGLRGRCGPVRAGAGRCGPVRAGAGRRSPSRLPRGASTRAVPLSCVLAGASPCMAGLSRRQGGPGPLAPLLIAATVQFSAVPRAAVACGHLALSKSDAARDRVRRHGPRDLASISRHELLLCLLAAFLHRSAAEVLRLQLTRAHAPAQDALEHILGEPIARTRPSPPAQPQRWGGRPPTGAGTASYGSPATARPPGAARSLKHLPRKLADRRAHRRARAGGTARGQRARSRAHAAGTRTSPPPCPRSASARPHRRCRPRHCYPRRVALYYLGPLRAARTLCVGLASGKQAHPPDQPGRRRHVGLLAVQVKHPEHELVLTARRSQRGARPRRCLTRATRCPALHARRPIALASLAQLSSTSQPEEHMPRRRQRQRQRRRPGARKEGLGNLTHKLGPGRSSAAACRRDGAPRVAESSSPLAARRSRSSSRRSHRGAAGSLPAAERHRHCTGDTARPAAAPAPESRSRSGACP